MSTADNQTQWVELHRNSRYRPKYPAEPVIRFVKRNFNPGEKILDAGCGAGRHVMFMANEGYIPFGVDYSPVAIEHTKTLLRENSMKQFVNNMLVSSCSDLPFDDCVFDGLVSYGVLYYLKWVDIQRSIREFYRVLKPGGRLLIVVRSTEDYRCLSGRKTGEHNTMIVTENAEDRSASSEEGMTMHFFDRDELQELFGIFDELEIDEMTVSHDNMTYYDRDFLITAIKSL